MYAYSFTKDGKEIFSKVATHGEDCDTLVHAMIDSIFANSCAGFTFYSHKPATFDTPFMIRAAAAYKAKGWYTNLLYHTDKKMLYSLTIGPSKEQAITFRNSRLIASGSLEKVADSFGLPGRLNTGAFPVSFVNSERLSYVGATPEAEYYSDPTKREVVES